MQGAYVAAPAPAYVPAGAITGVAALPAHVYPGLHATQSSGWTPPPMQELPAPQLQDAAMLDPPKENIPTATVTAPAEPPAQVAPAGHAAQEAAIESAPDPGGQ